MSVCVQGQSIGEAYRKALQSVFKNNLHFITIIVTRPVLSIRSTPESAEIDKWLGIINVGKEFDWYKDFDFGVRSEITGGSSGEDWINDRIEELLRGDYHKRISRDLDKIKDFLKKNKGKHSFLTNQLVIQVSEGVFDKSCLTQLQFKPKRDELHLFAVFRSQYFDTKVYGNLTSLTILLTQVCKDIDYNPGFVVNTTHNITFKVSKSKVKELLNKLSRHFQPSHRIQNIK